MSNAGMDFAIHSCPHYKTQNSGKTITRQLDKFYTRADIAETCVMRVKKIIRHAEKYCWIEPAAGAGAFLGFLPKPFLAFDIAPEHPQIVSQDFLKWQPSQANLTTSQKIITIGNPPFGKNASLALKFVQHAAKFSQTIAFILPRTFEKQSFQDKVPRNFNLVYQNILEPFAFTFNNEPYDVPAVFQIWHKTNYWREPKLRICTHDDFVFTTAELADFAFQRVGARAGLISSEGLKKSPQSHYFIKTLTKDCDVQQVLSAIDWANIKYKTAGNPSISKAELIKAYELAKP